MTRRGLPPKFMSFGVPPADVLTAAVCDSSTGYLFDHSVGDGERPPSREHRHAQARSICNGTGGVAPCAAREECLLWALEHGEKGVYGGRSVSTRMINRHKSKQQLSRLLLPLSVATKESA